VLAEQGDVDTVFASPRHPYTRLLLEAFPDVDTPERPLVGIPGVPPSLVELPIGCRFQPRCPVALDRCATEPPPVVTADGGHRVTCVLAVEEAEDG
jgi:peptide/nickel transport system ATP-binding protein